MSAIIGQTGVVLILGSLGGFAGLCAATVQLFVYRENRHQKRLDRQREIEQDAVKTKVDVLDVSHKSLAAALDRADHDIEVLHARLDAAELRVTAAEERERACWETVRELTERVEGLTDG